MLAVRKELPGLRVHAAFAMAGLGKCPEAIAAIREAFKIASTPSGMGTLGYCHARLGQREEAMRWVAELESPTGDKPVAEYAIAVIMAGLGEKDRAFEWLERAAARHNEHLPDLKTDFRMDSLRDDPRCDALLRRMHL